MIVEEVYNKFLKKIFVYQISIEAAERRRTKHKLKKRNIFSGNNTDMHFGRRT